jgi:membrane-associated HD superfamily phosphohydrolase
LKEEVDPFRHSLIGIAPLIFGSLGVVIIGQGQLGLFELGSKLTQGDFQALSQWFSDVISSPWSFIMLYLVFVIANGMFPSYPSDRANWHVVLLYMAVVAIILIALGITPTNIPPQFGEFGYQAMIHLLVAFSITIFLDMIIIGPLLVIQTLLHLITGR